MPPQVGVLALQGDFREHVGALDSLGVATTEVRLRDDLDGLDAIVVPGGESTTIGKLATRFGLLEPLRDRIRSGMPAFGTCAGMILLSVGVTDGDQPLLGVLDIVVERNAFGRQNQSFETDVAVPAWDATVYGVFIRAPWVAKVGSEVEVLATIDDHPVMVAQDRILATSFHPELTGDRTVHRRFLEYVG